MLLNRLIDMFLSCNFGGTTFPTHKEGVGRRSRESETEREDFQPYQDSQLVNKSHSVFATLKASPEFWSSPNKKKMVMNRFCKARKITTKLPFLTTGAAGPRRQKQLIPRAQPCFRFSPRSAFSMAGQIYRVPGAATSNGIIPSSCEPADVSSR